MITWRCQFTSRTRLYIEEGQYWIMFGRSQVHQSVSARIHVTYSRDIASHLTRPGGATLALSKHFMMHPLPLIVLFGEDLRDTVVQHRTEQLTPIDCNLFS